MSSVVSTAGTYAYLLIHYHSIKMKDIHPCCEATVSIRGQRPNHVPGPAESPAGQVPQVGPKI